MTPEKRDELLVKEYWELQAIVDKFSERALTVKGWSVTFSAATIAVAYTQHEPWLLIVAAVSAAAFWLTEAAWKAWQLAFFPRIDAIEDHFAGRGETAPLQASTSWKVSYCDWWIVRRL